MKRLILLCTMLGLLMLGVLGPASLAGAEGPCDLDGNGTYDTEDRKLLVSLAGLTRGEAGFEEAVDVDGDGVISAADLSAYLRSCR